MKIKSFFTVSKCARDDKCRCVEMIFGVKIKSDFSAMLGIEVYFNRL